MTDPETAREYVVRFVADALSRLKPGEERGAWWEIGKVWWDAVAAHPEARKFSRVWPDGTHTAESIRSIWTIPIKWTPGDQIRLMLGGTANPYDSVTPSAPTLADIPLAIAYERRGEVRCIVVSPRGTEDSPVAAVLSRSPILLPGITVSEAGRLFAGQYFRRDLARALRAVEAGAG